MREIKLPKTSKDLRIEHFNSFKEFEEDHMDLPAKVRFVAAFIGKSVNYVWSIDKNVFDKMYDHIMHLLSTLKINKQPPSEITINGVEYELINPHKVANGWHHDWNMLDIEKDPVKLACLFYHPKGHFYGEIDKNDNLIHPIRWKYDQFKKDIPLSTFIECATFFLLNWEKSTRLSMEKEIAKNKLKSLAKRLKSLTIKKQYMR